MYMTIEQFQKFANEGNIGFNDRVKVDVESVGRVPFINVGPQYGVCLQRFEIEGLITMGYKVKIVAAIINVVVPAPIEEITITAVISAPLVEEKVEVPVVVEETTEEVPTENQPEVLEETKVEAPVVEESTEEPAQEEDQSSDSEEELILQMNAKWLKDTLKVDELKVILETIGVKFGTKALENELANLIVKNQAKVKEHFKVA